METKTCSICFVEKSISEYYAHPRTRDKLQEKCKQCAKDMANASRAVRMEDPELREKEKARCRAKAKLIPKDKIRPRKKRAYRAQFPEKALAHSRTNRFVALESAGNNRHHWSYKPEHCIDTIELTPSQHGKLHRHMIYDRSCFMYRRIDTNELLDTREKHQAYADHVIKNLT